LTLSVVLSLTVLLGAARARADEPPATNAATNAAAKEVTLKGTLGCGKCSFHEAKACENVLKVEDGGKVETYLLADNAVSRANHEKVCGPASPATVTGTVSKRKSGPKATKDSRKVLTASAIKFDAP
jgi:Family of unknown function (DUF6370)